MTFREWASRLWGTFRKSRADRDLEEELRLHLELAAEDAHRRGEAPEQAARAARIRAGGTVQAMEALRDQRGLPWLDDLARDLRHGCRMLAANPGFALVSVLSLAIGVGANCAVFSFADTLLLRPLTVPRPAEVLTVGSTSAATIRPILHASYRDYVDVRDRKQRPEATAVDPDRPDLPAAVSIRVEHDGFPVRHEPGSAIARGIIGQTPQSGAVGGADQDVLLAPALGVEEHAAAVGRHI